MSDSEDSTITYTEVSSPYEDLSDTSSPGVMVYRYDGLPMHPPSPDYVPGPKEPEQAPPSPVYVPYVPEPVYPKFMPPEDDVLPAEEQQLPTTLSPTVDSPRYIADSDPEEDPEEDPADYPIDGGEDDDDDDESSDDDKDDDDVKEDESEEEEEEHLALVDSASSPAYRVTARMSIRPQTPVPFPSKEEVDRLLAISTPPPSPLTPLSSPLPQISFPPLPASPTHSLGYRAAMIQLRAESPSTSHPLPLPSPIVLPHTRASMTMMRAATPSTYILAPPSGTPPLLPIPLPTSSPPLLLPSTDSRADVPEVVESSSTPTTRPTRGFRAYYGFVGTLDAEIRRGLEREIGYGITDTWGEMVKDVQRRPTATDRRSMDASDIARSETMALRTIVLAQQVEIGALWTADHTRQAQLVEELTLMRTLQTQMTTLQSQQGPTSGPAQPDVPEEASSSS
ncbi:hypothetical protein Tco_0620514 [Tanacetum coccineum]